MELSMRTIVVLMVLLIATLVFATLILGWGNESTRWMNMTFSPFFDLIMQR